MKIVEIRALRGPNYYSNQPIIIMKLDIEELESTPTDLIPNFRENIELMIPSLYEHTCSPGRTGGFFERVARGTWAGHVVEHIAIELQVLAGYTLTFGKTYSTGEKGVYIVVFRYIDEDAGIRAAQISVDITEKLFNGVITDIAPLIKELKTLGEENLLGPSTQSIVDEASRRGIPHIRLNSASFVQLGYGVNQRKIQATIADNTSFLAVEIAGDKARTKSLLSSMGIPVAQGLRANTGPEALKAAEKIGYPLVVKPLDGNHGRGITTNITTPEELLIAFEKSREIGKTSLVEKHLEGNDFRVLVIDGKFVAAALREPAFVVGNGINTIQELIEEINRDPQRGVAHEKSLTQIQVDSMTERLLEKEKLTLESVPQRGRKVYLKDTGNISAGATAEDVTESVHPLNRLIFERISRIIDLNIMGIDIMATSLEIPLTSQACGVLEVNAAPGFRMHLNPSLGEKRNIASHVVDMLFPRGSSHSVPIVAVTGTNGKTTTIRLIAHILKTSGWVVGMTSTDAVEIDSIPILKGDYSGPEGASKVLMDSSVDYAVLEVARGGILRRGLGFKESDVGVLLNITSDHLGEGGIETLEQLTRLKSTVTEAVKPSGYAVLNADDPLVLSRLDKVKASPILFSKNPKNQALVTNYEKGNYNVTLIDETIVVESKEKTIIISSVVEIPLTFNGKATFNVENVLASVAASFALGLDPAKIRGGLLSFNPSMDQSRGRMNVIDMGEFKVIIDYGHNPGAIAATGDFIRGFMPGRKIRVTSGSGNRKTEDILELGVGLARYYDHILLCDTDRRQRQWGETSDIIKEGLLKGGLGADKIRVILDERKAVEAALTMAKKDDLVVIQAHNINQVIQDVLDYKLGLEEE